MWQKLVFFLHHFIRFDGIFPRFCNYYFASQLCCFSHLHKRSVCVCLCTLYILYTIYDVVCIHSVLLVIFPIWISDCEFTCQSDGSNNFQFITFFLSVAILKLPFDHSIENSFGQSRYFFIQSRLHIYANRSLLALSFQFYAEVAVANIICIQV